MNEIIPFPRDWNKDQKLIVQHCLDTGLKVDTAMQLLITHYMSYTEPGTLGLYSDCNVPENILPSFSKLCTLPDSDRRGLEIFNTYISDKDLFYSIHRLYEREILPIISSSIKQKKIIIVSPDIDAKYKVYYGSYPNGKFTGARMSLNRIIHFREKHRDLHIVGIMSNADRKFTDIGQNEKLSRKRLEQIFKDLIPYEMEDIDKAYCLPQNPKKKNYVEMFFRSKEVIKSTFPNNICDVIIPDKHLIHKLAQRLNPEINIGESLFVEYFEDGLTNGFSYLVDGDPVAYTGINDDIVFTKMIDDLPNLLKRKGFINTNVNKVFLFGDQNDRIKKIFKKFDVNIVAPKSKVPKKLLFSEAVNITMGEKGVFLR